MNDWKAGDRYHTDDGTLVMIAKIEKDGEGHAWIDVIAEDMISHVFDLNGRSLCALLGNEKHTHGHLARRLTGTIQDAGWR